MNWPWSVIYSLFQISQGLLFHPYQTMQSLVREKVFVMLTLLPTLFLALTTIFWRLIFVPTVRMVFSCQVSGFIACDWLPLIANWLIFFCIYWQVLLLYLFYRFSKVLRDFE